MNPNVKTNWDKDSVQQHYWNYLQWTHEEFEGIEFKDLALNTYGTDDEIEGGNLCLEGGYESLLNVLKPDLDIRLNQVVTSIEDFNTYKITIKTRENQAFYCKKVLVTVPLGVLKSKLIKFSPELPDNKLEAINLLDMGLMNKVILRFSDFFWEKSLHRIFNISNTKGEFPWFDSQSIEEPVLLGWIANSYAENLEKLSDKEIVGKAMNVLRTIFKNKDIPDPVEYYVTKWMSDPFSKGSWSVKPKGSSIKHNSILAMPIYNLYFSGEATTYKWPGTAHGAFSTGIEQAKLIFSQFQSKEI